MRKFLSRKKKILICLTLIFTVTIFSYNQQRANANPVVLVIGGIVFAPEVAALLLISAGAYCGYEIYDEYRGDIQNYWENKLLNLSLYALEAYFSVQENASGDEYLTLTEDGYDWAHTDWDAIKQANDELDSIKFMHTSTSTTTNTTPNLKEPFMYNGFYLKNYSGVGIYETFDILANNTITVCFTTSCNPGYAIPVFKPLQNCTIRFGQLANGNCSFQYSYDSGVTWRNFSNEQYSKVGADNYFGYKTITNTVYVPYSQAIRETGIESGIKEGEVVAVPISGQYVVDGVVHYPAIDGVTAGAVSGLSAKTDSGTTVGVGEGTIADSLTQSDITESVEDGITNTLDIPTSDIPVLNFNPLMVATQKFPFCIPWDLWQTYKVFEGNAQPFKYEFKRVDVNFSFIGCGSVTVLPNFTLNFADYPQVDNAIQVIKFLELIGFIVFLILKTRNIIRG